MSRRVAIAALMFLSCSVGILCAFEEHFLRALLKGGMLAVIVIPLANSYYGDQNRFKFSLWIIYVYFLFIRKIRLLSGKINFQINTVHEI